MGKISASKFLKANQVVQARRASAICVGFEFVVKFTGELYNNIAFVLLLESSGFSRKNFELLKLLFRINECLHSFSLRISSIIVTSTQRLLRL